MLIFITQNRVICIQQKRFVLKIYTNNTKTDHLINVIFDHFNMVSCVITFLYHLREVRKLQKIQTQNQTVQQKTRSLVESSFLIALVFVATLFINIKLPIAANGGLVHLGSAMLFTSAIVFGPKKGAIAGAFGMGLFDLVSGWTLWAPFTFVIRGLQGWIIGYLAHSTTIKLKLTLKNALAIILSIPIMLTGYYFCEVILYNSWVIPFASVTGNIVQNVVGLIVALPLCLALQKLQRKQ